MRVFKWALLYRTRGGSRTGPGARGRRVQGQHLHPQRAGLPRAGRSMPSGRFTITWTSNLQDANSFGIYAQRYAADGAPAGSEFLVPTVTSTVEGLSNVAYSPGGNSMIVWHGAGNPGFDIRAQRYAPNGTPRGGEFVVNTYTGGNEYRPDVAPLPGGGFVVAWSSHLQYSVQPHPGPALRCLRHPAGPGVGGDSRHRFGLHQLSLHRVRGGRQVRHRLGTFVDTDRRHRRPALRRLRQPGRAPSSSSNRRRRPATRGRTWPWPRTARSWSSGRSPTTAASTASGAACSRRTGRRWAPSSPSMPATAGVPDAAPAVGVDRLGDFVVSWSSRPAGAYDVVARRFSPTGVPRSGDFRVNTFTTGNQSADDVASDEVGNFVVELDRGIPGRQRLGVFAQRFGGLLPAALAVDTASSPQSDGNGVLEPGRRVAVRPSWRNVNGGAQTFTGTILALRRPGRHPHHHRRHGQLRHGGQRRHGPCVGLLRRQRVRAQSASSCSTGTPLPRRTSRPTRQGQRKRWRLHMGDSFADVPRANAFYRFVETLLHHFVTAGCTATEYCPLTPDHARADGGLRGGGAGRRRRSAARVRHADVQRRAGQQRVLPLDRGAGAVGRGHRLRGRKLLPLRIRSAARRWRSSRCARWIPRWCLRPAARRCSRTCRPATPSAAGSRSWRGGAW